MSLKTFEKNELLPAKNLRIYSQSKLLGLLKNHDKVGIVVSDELSIAMLSWNKFEMLADTIEQQNRRIEELESQLEDVLLSKAIGSEVMLAEQGKTKEYAVDSIDEAFNMLDNR